MDKLRILLHCATAVRSLVITVMALCSLQTRSHVFTLSFSGCITFTPKMWYFTDEELFFSVGIFSKIQKENPPGSEIEGWRACAESTWIKI